MNGAEFLALVARRRPTAIRFLLSGFTGTEALDRAGIAHETFEKPWNDQVLLAAIERYGGAAT
jgi:hypothetical protein